MLTIFCEPSLLYALLVLTFAFFCFALINELSWRLLRQLSMRLRGGFSCLMLCLFMLSNLLVLLTILLTRLESGIYGSLLFRPFLVLCCLLDRGLLFRLGVQAFHEVVQDVRVCEL